MKRRLKVFFDGGCRPNPGMMEAAVVVRGQEHFFDDLGTGSSTEAEWLALLRAIELADGLGLQDVEFIGDSLQVVRQANEALATRLADEKYARALLVLVNCPSRLRIRWVKRSQNLAGIALQGRQNGQR